MANLEGDRVILNDSQMHRGHAEQVLREAVLKLQVLRCRGTVHHPRKEVGGLVLRSLLQIETLAKRQWRSNDNVAANTNDPTCSRLLHVLKRDVAKCWGKVTCQSSPVAEDATNLNESVSAEEQPTNNANKAS